MCPRLTLCHMCSVTPSEMMCLPGISSYPMRREVRYACLTHALFLIRMLSQSSQFCYAKSFDKFAPIGPVIVAANLIPDPQKLHYVTKVNGKVRQETETSDMIFPIAKIISHLSRGTTLRKGTVIQTGTPSGVGLFMEPKGFLKDGDVVEVTVDGIGSIRNKMVFEK